MIRTVHYKDPGRGWIYNCTILVEIPAGRLANDSDLKRYLKYKHRPITEQCPHWPLLKGPTECDRVILMGPTGVTYLVPVTEQYLPSLVSRNGILLL